MEYDTISDKYRDFIENEVTLTLTLTLARTDFIKNEVHSNNTQGHAEGGTLPLTLTLTLTLPLPLTLALILTLGTPQDLIGVFGQIHNRPQRPRHHGLQDPHPHPHSHLYTNPLP